MRVFITPPLRYSFDFQNIDKNLINPAIMKRVSVVCLFVFAFTISFAQRKKMGASGFYIETLYQQVKAKDVEKYLAIFSDSLKLGSSMKLPAQTGLGVGFIYYMEGVELDMGFTARPQSFNMSNTVSNGTTTASLKMYGTELKAGMNFYPGKGNFFMGFLLTSSAFNQKIAITSTDPAINNSLAQGGSISGSIDFESHKVNLLDFMNFSYQRVMMVKLQAGINIRLSKYGQTMLKISPYYDYGLTKYNFLSASNIILNTYTGPGKSKLNDYGIRLAILFGK